MPFASVTWLRLRLRSARYLPGFAWGAVRVNAQAGAAAGFRAGEVRSDRRRTFWTLTLWDDRDAMRGFMLGGPHGAIMRHLAAWCDEASVAHWTVETAALPAWDEAVRRMRADGRPSPVRHPSAGHAALAFPDPRSRRGVPIRRTTDRKSVLF